MEKKKHKKHHLKKQLIEKIVLTLKLDNMSVDELSKLLEMLSKSTNAYLK